MCGVYRKSSLADVNTPEEYRTLLREAGKIHGLSGPVSPGCFAGGMAGPDEVRFEAASGIRLRSARRFQAFSAPGARSRRVRKYSRLNATAGSSGFQFAASSLYCSAVSGSPILS